MCDVILNKKLKEKFDESVSAVLPITVIVLLLSIFVVPMETGTIALFLVGAFMLIIGMAFFQLGAEMAMTPLGEGVGSHIMKTKRLSILIIGLLCDGCHHHNRRTGSAGSRQSGSFYSKRNLNLDGRSRLSVSFWSSLFCVSFSS